MMKKLVLLLTEGDEEKVTTILHRKVHPNQFGKITPPVIVSNHGQDYVLKSQYMMDGVYIYRRATRVDLDDILGSPLD